MELDETVYRGLIEAAPDAIVGVAPDGRIILLNAQTEVLFGYARGELLGQSVDLLVPEAVRSAHPGHRDAYFAHPTTRPMGAGMELAARRRDGSEFPAEISLSSIDTDAGPLVAAVIRDVSERRAADARFRSFLEAAPDAIVGVGPDGRIVLVNAQTEALFGYPRHELVGQSVDLLVPESVRSAHVVHRDEFFAHPTTRPMGAGMELAARRRDGSEFSAEISLSAIDTERGPLALAAVRDGTDRRQAAIVNSTAEAIVSTDLGGAITTWNPGAHALFGFTRAEMLGRHIEVLIPADEVEAERVVLARAGRGEVVAEYESIRLTADDRVVHVSTSVAPIVESGVLRGFSIISRDITDRKRIEAERRDLESRLRQSERLESLGQLAGGIAHDFNNLLSVILNYAVFVSEEIEDPTVRADVDEIRLAAERAARLTNQLLIFGRRDTAQLEVLDVNAIARDVHQLLSRTLGEHIELAMLLADTGAPALVDRGQMEQVLVNLAVNARDAMPTGGILTIETATIDVGDDVAATLDVPPGPYVQLSVSDTGSGMDANTVEHAFEPFFTTKPKGQGTGLGLATVYGIVAQVAGTITLYSEPDLGTTVRVYLPHAQQRPPEDRSAPAEAIPTGSGTRVLVVDDEEAMGKVAARILQRNGYQVEHVTSADDALARLDDIEVDVLLTDVVMPSMSGPELADRVRARHPEVLVCFMSGYSEGVLGPERGLDTGMFLVQKPFGEAVLLATLRDLLASTQAFEHGPDQGT